MSWHDTRPATRPALPNVYASWIHHAVCARSGPMALLVSLALGALGTGCRCRPQRRPQSRMRKTSLAPRSSKLVRLALLMASGSFASAETSAQRQALIALYNATHGAHWRDSSGWLKNGTDACTWRGVACDAVLGSVTALNLADNQLQGTLPTQIGMLPGVVVAQLQANALSGTLPSELGALGDLGQLTFYDNALSGTLPSEVGLTRVQRLATFGNRLSGTIPTQVGALPFSDVCLFTRDQYTNEYHVNATLADSNRFWCPLPSFRAAACTQFLHCVPPPSPSQPPPSPVLPPMPSSPPPADHRLQPGQLALLSLGSALGLLVLAVAWLRPAAVRRLLQLQQHAPDGALAEQDSVKVSLELVSNVAGEKLAPLEARFLWDDVQELERGNASNAVRGLAAHMGLSDEEMHTRMGQGLQAIKREWTDHGTDEDRECLDYVLHQVAGTSKRVFPNGCRDRDRGPLKFHDFVQHPRSQAAALTDAHVLALRLYTTAAYKSINHALRSGHDAAKFAATIGFLADGIKKLRSPEACSPGAGSASVPNSPKEKVVLWRGLRNTALPEDFLLHGGTMHAPMSTTHDPEVALRYAISKRIVLFRIVATSFMSAAPNLEYLSAFPDERECLYPPMTYLQPGTLRSMTLGGHEVSVLDVEAHMGT